jgi:hypothetical protein
MRNSMAVGGLGLLVAALSVAAALVAGQTFLASTDSASANQPDAALEFTIHAGGADSAGDAKGAVDIAIGAVIPVTVSLDAIPSPYDAVAVTVNYSGVLQGQFENAAKGSPDIVWPDCAFEAPAPAAAGSINAGCAKAADPAPSSSFTGTVFTANVTCESAGAGTVSLLHGPADTLIIGSAGSGGKTSTEAGPDAININCIPATNTFTPTPTATPPPIPRMFKDPVLSNVFLTRQGTKIPPQRCDDSTNVATLTEQINQVPVTINPKGEAQDVAAFEFEVRFDPTKVCVNLAAAGDFGTDPSVICFVQDKDSSTLEGIARIGCISVGKGNATDGLLLATIEVRPQPELYSQIRPNQDNGNAIQVLNQNCELADEQGHAIPIFSCEDADITFRYLEGDVDGPDCDVDVVDAQQVAFRWGVNKGSLLYNSFMDLEPSGQVKGDGDIDIKDIQFVFGRFASTCTTPWPSQIPVNPKGGPTPSGQSSPTPTFTPCPTSQCPGTPTNTFTNTPTNTPADTPTGTNTPTDTPTNTPDED